MKKNKSENLLSAYYRLCNKITIYFIENYFGNTYDVDWYWIADDIGGVINVGDYFFNFSDIVELLEVNPPKKRLFEWYDYDLEKSTEIMEWEIKKDKCDRPVKSNIRNYFMLEAK